MRLMILIAFVLAPQLASAQPTGSGSAGSGSAGSGSAAVQPADPPPPAPAPAPAPSAADLRKICADALNADATFAMSIAETVNAETVKQHRNAADAISKNEKHVFMAYAAMWVIAAGFLLFMWRRQQGLKNEIAQLKRDLEAAAK